MELDLEKWLPALAALATILGVLLLHRRETKKRELETQQRDQDRHFQAEMSKAEVQKSVIENVDRIIHELQEVVTSKQNQIDEQREEIGRLQTLLQEVHVEASVHRSWAVSIQIPLWIKSLSHRFVFVNTAWQDLTGFRLPDIQGKTNHEIGLPSQVATDWQRGDERAIQADGALTVTRERTVTASGAVLSGKAGKWVIKVAALGDQKFIFGAYIADDLWEDSVVEK